jgi:uncharacterized protein (DUF305 family)
VSLPRRIGAAGLLTIVAVLVSVASLALVFFDQPPGEDSAEAGFARDMSVHHAQAVELSQIVLDKTEDPAIKNLATDITLTQQSQIGRMQGWLSTWGLPISGTGERMAWMGHTPEGRMPGMASPEELNRLRNAGGKEADEIFLRLMIPHHQAAIPMSEAILERSDNGAVTSLAEAIIPAQSSEIQVMREMRQERGFEPLNGSSGGGRGDHENGG